MRPALATLLVVLVALTGVAPRRAVADEAPSSPAAAALWAEGQRLYQEGRYREATERFERGRAIEPRPEFLYALGQAARKAGDCTRAIEHYRLFIIESRTPPQVEAARLQITRCEAELAAAARRAAEVEPPRDPPPARAAPTRVERSREAPPRASHRPWYRDALGLGLMGGGLIALGGGSVFVQRSRRDLDGDRTSYGSFEAALEARRRDRAIGISLASAGGVLVTAALLRFWIWPAEDGPSAGVLATPDGGAAVLRGTF